MKICLFGGSFNPPHIAHKQIVMALKKEKFDQLYIVPTGKPNHKQIEISDQDRILLVKAFAKECDVMYSLHEIENNFSYTVESLDFLNLADDNIYFTIGGDSVNSLPTWDYFDRLKTMVTFVIINRPGLDLDPNVLSAINYMILDCKTEDVSSTDLRNNLNRELVPAAVLQVIEEHNLYA